MTFATICHENLAGPGSRTTTNRSGKPAPDAYGNSGSDAGTQRAQRRWITSSFDHYQKRQRLPRAQEVMAEENLCITILPGSGYRRNLGVARIVHNLGFARAVTKFASETNDEPDIIVTDIPTTETAAAAAKLSLARNVKLIVSVRDVWPDSFARLVPPFLAPLTSALLYPFDRQARFACAHASAIVSISHSYLDWGLKKANRAQGPHDRVIPLGYAPNSLPVARQRQSLLSAMGVKEGCKLVAFIGTWGHSYDLELVLGAARKLASRKDMAPGARRGMARSLAPYARKAPTASNSSAG